MLQFRAWMLYAAVVVLLAGFIGCASTESSRSSRNSAYGTSEESPPARGSCH
jgi:hypothetical protein